MQEIETNYYNLIRQNVKCTGTIKNVYKGLIIRLETKDCVSKKEFLIGFLSRFRSTYAPFPQSSTTKEYKKFLKDEIEYTQTKLEELKFAHKICGRKILED